MKFKPVPTEATLRTGPVFTALMSAVSALFLSGFGQLVGWDWKVPVVIAVVMIFCWVIVGWRLGHARETIGFRATCWAAFAVWTTLALYAEPREIFLGWLGISLPLGTGALGVLAFAFGNTEAVIVAEGRDDRGVKLDTMPKKVAYLIHKHLNMRTIGWPSVEVVREWPKNAGVNVLVEFPEMTEWGYDDVSSIVKKMSRALRQKPGCPITLAPGPHEGSAILKIPFFDNLAADFSYQLADGRQSIVNPFVIGTQPDGDGASGEAHQSSWVIVGKRGSGKTVLTHVLTARFMECWDTITFHVDLTGRLPLPWVYPTMTGQIGRHMLGGVAVSLRDADRLADILLAIADGRNTAYAAKMLAEGVDVLPTKYAVAIEVIIDEGGRLMGADACAYGRRVAAKFMELQKVGRAMLVHVHFSVQRGTQDYLPVAVRKNAGIVLVGKVNDDSEIAYATDWDNGARSRDLIHKGTFFMRTDQGPLEMIKVARLLPPDILRICQATVDRRPDMDPLSAELGGRWLAEIWDTPDCRAWLARVAVGDLGPDDERENLDDIISAVDSEETFRFYARSNGPVGAPAVEASGPSTATAVMDPPATGGDPALNATLERIKKQMDANAAGAAATDGGGPAGPTPPGYGDAPPPADGAEPQWLREGLAAIDSAIGEVYDPGDPATRMRRAAPTAGAVKVDGPEVLHAFLLSQSPRIVERPEIIEYLRGRGVLGDREETADNWLSKLVKDGKVTRQGRGKYQAVA